MIQEVDKEKIQEEVDMVEKMELVDKVEKMVLVGMVVLWVEVGKVEKKVGPLDMVVMMEVHQDMVHVESVDQVGHCEVQDLVVLHM